MKRLIKIVLILLLIFTTLPTTTAVAATKLNESKLTLDEGSIFQLQLKGTAKSIKWSSSNSKIAKVSNKGKVTAVKAGTAIITAKVSKKTYRCNVKVKDVLTEKEAAQNITYESAETSQGLVLIFKNENNVNISLKANVSYYDASNKVLSAKEKRILVFQSKSESILTFTSPDSYDKYTITFTVDIGVDFNFPSETNNIKMDVNAINGVITTKLTNLTNDTCLVSMTVLFYKDGIIVGFEDRQDIVIYGGSDCTIEFSNPDENSGEITYDDYKVIINEAYAG